MSIVRNRFDCDEEHLIRRVRPTNFSKSSSSAMPPGWICAIRTITTKNYEIAVLFEAGERVRERGREPTAGHTSGVGLKQVCFRPAL
ncbi:MAG: hypothetical protein ACT4O1_13525 [Gemmatimonadota bacterium]